MLPALGDALVFEAVSFILRLMDGGEEHKQSTSKMWGIGQGCTQRSLGRFGAGHGCVGGHLSTR